MEIKKPCPLVSYCFFMFLQLGKSLPSSYLATKLETWQPLRAELVESIPSQKNLEARYKLGKILQSCNLAAKFEFSTWHKRGTSLAVIKYNASGKSSTMICFTLSYRVLFRHGVFGLLNNIMI